MSEATGKETDRESSITRECVREKSIVLTGCAGVCLVQTGSVQSHDYKEGPSSHEKERGIIHVHTCTYMYIHSVWLIMAYLLGY
jgi:hypothetical protein